MKWDSSARWVIIAPAGYVYCCCSPAHDVCSRNIIRFWTFHDLDKMKSFFPWLIKQRQLYMHVVKEPFGGFRGFSIYCFSEGVLQFIFSCFDLRRWNLWIYFIKIFWSQFFDFLIMSLCTERIRSTLQMCTHLLQWLMLCLYTRVYCTTALVIKLLLLLTVRACAILYNFRTINKTRSHKWFNWWNC